MKKRTVINSPRLNDLRKRRRKVLRNKILLLLAAILIILGVIAYFLRNSIFNISGINITGNKVVDAQMIQETIDADISGNYLWIFPKSNILFYPKNQIETDLNNKFQRLKNISISVNNKKTLEVSVDERTGIYTWCGATIPQNIDSSQKCYFMDMDGYIFDEAPFFSGEVYFKFYGPVEEKGGKPLAAYFAKDYFTKIVSFKKTLEDLKLKPVAADVTGDGDLEMYLSSASKSASGPKIILKVDADFNKVAENLEAALTTEPLLSGFKNKYSDLQYIDLRYGNKVYYKFTNGAVPTTPTQ